MVSRWPFLRRRSLYKALEPPLQSRSGIRQSRRGLCAQALPTLSMLTVGLGAILDRRKSDDAMEEVGRAAIPRGGRRRSSRIMSRGARRVCVRTSTCTNGDAHRAFKFSASYFFSHPRHTPPPRSQLRMMSARSLQRLGKLEEPRIGRRARTALRGSRRQQRLAWIAASLSSEECYTRREALKRPLTASTSGG